MKRLVVIFVAKAVLLSACSQPSGSMNPSKNVPASLTHVSKLNSVENLKNISLKSLTADQQRINGPVLGMVDLEHHFEITLTPDNEVINTRWNMGDGSPSAISYNQIDHTYTAPGIYTVTATVNFKNGDKTQINHEIRVLPYVDGMECVRDLAISGPRLVTQGLVFELSLNVPQCLAWRLRSISWDFGDATPKVGNPLVTHAYLNVGQYVVNVDLFDANASSPFLTITQNMLVVADPNLPQEPAPEPPAPVPSDPLACPAGDSRQLSGEPYTQERACGVNGRQTLTYRDLITEECLRTGGEDGPLRWVEVSRTRELTNEGECTGVACEISPQALNGVDITAAGLLFINGRYYLPDGEARVFYSETHPRGACTEVAETRSCTNGVLGGSQQHQYLGCRNGCPGIGPDGATITVVSGEESVPRTCQFLETDIFDIFNQISDLTCTNGSGVSSNTRRGDMKTQGVCPSYTWFATDEYSACTADCGGEQAQIFACRDQQGRRFADERCGAPAPIVTRVCDGNPEAVRRTEASTILESSGRSQTCPANQIGTVISQREVTTTKIYACVNHVVDLESTTVSEGPWVEERLCRDYVPHRCSQDPLDEQEAYGRLRWMLNCRNRVPVIDEFLKEFADYIRGEGESAVMKYKGDPIYATFIERKGGREKVWHAPRWANSSCRVPATVSIAAICNADCATAEQTVLGQRVKGGRLQYVPIVDAWADQFQFVATLGGQKSMSSKLVQRTRVDRWVAESADSIHEIIELTMQSGGQLRVTEGHPLLSPEGRMRRSGDFKVGDSLVRQGGALDPIVAIRRVSYQGKVYNVFVHSSEPSKNVIITNGYLNGSGFFQAEGVKYLNRQILRGEFLRGVFVK